MGEEQAQVAVGLGEVDAVGRLQSNVVGGVQAVVGEAQVGSPSGLSRQSSVAQT